jgi:hypothetical protein
VKKLIPIVFMLVLAGCSSTQWANFQTTFTKDTAAIEAKVTAFIAAWKKNAPIVLADAQQAVALSCNLITLGQSGLATFEANVSGVSDATQGKLDVAATYLNKGAAGCVAYNNTQASNPTASAAANTTLAAWNAYIAAKAQINAAQVSAASK